MKIGFVSTWFERGAAYVTKQYADLLEKEGHEVYIYARGESYAIGNPKWDKPNVTWGKKLYDTTLDFKDFTNWIKKTGVECIFFNEQRDIISVIRIKIAFPQIKIGTYIDYYKQDTVDDFKYYDFLICNTKRHFSVFSKFDQCFYVPWGTDTNLYTYKKTSSEHVRFFHSAGMSNRKGTDVLIDAFINGEIYKKAELIIHTQIPIENLVKCKIENWSEYNITIVEKTVSAPGLYYMGDVYVYPTTLDGLGLTMYEALASGLPVITTDCPPMNEVINEQVGKLVKVDDYKCRWDAYYWPLAYVNEKSLAEAMQFYVDHIEELPQLKNCARTVAEKNWEWNNRKKEIAEIFVGTHVKKMSRNSLLNDIKKYKRKDKKEIGKSIMPFIPHVLQEIYFKNR